MRARLDPASNRKDSGSHGGSRSTTPFAPGIMVIDRSMRVSGWNPHMEDISGLSFDEVRRRECWTVLAGTPGCEAECNLARGALRGERQPTVRMLIPCGAETCDALVATSTVWFEGGAAILHLVSSFGTRKRAANEATPLTPRQR